MNRNQLQAAAEHLEKKDKILRSLLKKISLEELEPNKDLFTELVLTIVSQQLAAKAAQSIGKRLLKYFKGKPTPKKIIALPEGMLKDKGVSLAKERAMRSLSEKIITKEIVLKDIVEKPENEIRSMLVNVKGIGNWTVDMFLMFSLAKPDVLAIGDLGVKKGIMKCYSLPELPTETKILEMAKEFHWSPYSSVVCRLMWKSLEL